MSIVFVLLHYTPTFLTYSPPKDLFLTSPPSACRYAPFIHNIVTLLLLLVRFALSHLVFRSTFFLLACGSDSLAALNHLNKPGSPLALLARTRLRLRQLATLRQLNKPRCAFPVLLLFLVLAAQRCTKFSCYSLSVALVLLS
jgi:hypothetical protein